MSQPKPKLAEHEVRRLLSMVPERVAILGVRGYRRDTMGVPGRNDVGIYDDAMFLVAPNLFVPANANTDPSKLGWNAAIGKPFAMLQPGLWYFIRGSHKGKAPALRQATEDEAEDAHIPEHGHFAVWRAKDMADVLSEKARTEHGYFAINIHRGGEASTSSWGCQTLPPGEFDHFMLNVWEASRLAGQERIPYLLVDGPLA